MLSSTQLFSSLFLDISHLCCSSRGRQVLVPHIDPMQSNVAEIGQVSLIAGISWQAHLVLTLIYVFQLCIHQ